jgi:hypothetical protein
LQLEEYLTVHYKGNIPKGALGAIQSPRRRRNNIERNDSDASDYDDELLNERSIRNKSSKTVDRGGTIRRDKESSYDHEIAVVSASMRQNKLADRFHDQKGSQSRRFEVNNEDNLVYSDSRGRNDKKATNFQRVPYRRYSEGVDSQEDFSDDNYSEDDGLRNRRNREKDKKTNLKRANIGGLRVSLWRLLLFSRKRLSMVLGRDLSAETEQGQFNHHFFVEAQ